MEPVLIEVPERIDSERLILRCPGRGDGAALNAAVAASLLELEPWLPWAASMPTLDESEAHCRRQQARYILREDLAMLMFWRDASGEEGELVGGIGLHRIDWTLRRFEIGYWRKSGLEGRGIATEAVVAIARMAFDKLDARRVEIRTDNENERSWKVAERAHFTLEAVLRFDAVTRTNQPRSSRVYARVRGAEESMVTSTG
ncbi:MAG: GNAT family N-acetyltransferase [Pseudomonadota bacterium]|nr:GNAT family N-acetyltransferase [Pseudomonadota bacterium]